MNIYDIFGSGRKPAVTESKIEVVHEYVNEDFSGLMFGANNEDIAGPGGSDNNDSTSPIHGFGEDYDNIPDLENVGEQVVSIMDAERRLAQGDRIFAFHEMDEEPSEIHDVGQLAGYDAEQLLAVPQGVAEGSLEEIDRRGFLKGVGAAAVAGVGGKVFWDRNQGTAKIIRPMLGLYYYCKSPESTIDVWTCNQVNDSIKKFTSTNPDIPGHGSDAKATLKIYWSQTKDKLDDVKQQDPKKWAGHMEWYKQNASNIIRDFDGLMEFNESVNQGVAEGGAETSWSNDTGTITLQDILELTKHIKQINLPINDNLKSKLLHWEGNPEEIERVNQVTVSNQFPILIMVDEQGQIAWILDGNHRLHKAIQSQAKTIPAKLIKPSNLNDKAKKIFNIKEQGVAEAPHDDEVDYDDKYQAMVKRVGQKAREQQRHEPVDLVKLAQRLRQADKTTDTTDEDVMESRLSAMKRAGYDIL